MKRWSQLLVLWSCLAIASAAEAGERQALRRLALVVGANDGGPDRARLRYANSDALAVGSVLVELGGVAGDDAAVVVDASVPAVLGGLSDLAVRVRRARATARRVEALFYYSGHSDENGLLLSGARLGYTDLRRAIGSVGADVRIAVVDSCAAGALTRGKGGVKLPPFLVDTSTRISGHAFLMSSSEDEVAQESDRIGASFFTHYLLSGLRGAADVSQDGLVTLGEAYRYAYDETLARTERTRSGPQHAKFDIQLVGTGDLVLTDLRGSAARVSLSAGLGGRLTIRDSSGRLVVELRKEAGKAVFLGLAPGRYAVTAEVSGAVLGGVFTLSAGGVTVLRSGDLGPVALEQHATRGAEPPQARPGEVGVEVIEAVEVEEEELVHVPFNAALLPSISVNGQRRVVNSFALSLLAGDGEELRGAELSLGANLRGRRMHGVQLAAGANVTSGEARGVQVAAGYDQAGSLLGLQISGGANVATEDMAGCQAAFGYNHAGEAVGLQVAGVNVALHGFLGLQAGAVNYAGGDVRGAQIGGVNVGDEVKGAQIGFVNVGRDVRGTQIGFVNLAEGSDVPIGVLNIVRDGLHEVSLTTSELSPLGIGLRFGGRFFYTLVSAGVQPHVDPVMYDFGLGIGVHVPLSERVFLAFDLAAHRLTNGSDFDTHSHVLARTRIMVGFRLFEQLAIVAGAAGSALVELDYARVPTQAYGWQTVLHTEEALQLSAWPGFFLGLEI